MADFDGIDNEFVQPDGPSIVTNLLRDEHSSPLVTSIDAGPQVAGANTTSTHAGASTTRLQADAISASVDTDPDSLEASSLSSVAKGKRREERAHSEEESRVAGKRRAERAHSEEGSRPATRLRVHSPTSTVNIDNNTETVQGSSLATDTLSHTVQLPESVHNSSSPAQDTPAAPATIQDVESTNTTSNHSSKSIVEVDKEVRHHMLQGVIRLWLEDNSFRLEEVAKDPTLQYLYDQACQDWKSHNPGSKEEPKCSSFIFFVFFAYHFD